MEPEVWRRVEELCQQALELDEGRRAEFLESLVWKMTPSCAVKWSLFWLTRKRLRVSSNHLRWRWQAKWLASEATNETCAETHRHYSFPLPNASQDRGRGNGRRLRCRRHRSSVGALPLSSFPTTCPRRAGSQPFPAGSQGRILAEPPEHLHDP